MNAKVNLERRHANSYVAHSKHKALITIPVLLILTIYFIATYNGLVRLRNNARRSFGTIDVSLKKRHDLIPNLVAAAKQFMTHEKDLLSNITQIRAEAMSGSGSEKMAAEAQLSSMLGQLNVAMENYPDLKSDQNVLHLQATLNEVEEQIGASRNAYNSSVTRLNNKIESFPSSLVARIFGFRQQDVFEASEVERKNVNVGELFK